jgi:uncharacterized repeat protein (TIGR01451 family)
MGMFVPNVAATKTAVLGTDVNGNGFVNPGDTLTYSVVVANTGTDATNVVFTDQLNGDLTLIGAAIASPIATNDAYAVLGNVAITVPAGSGLLVNDVNPQGTGTMTISAGTTTAQGGNLSVAANGSFTYNPRAGFEGSDTFTYTLTHSNGKTDTGTVTFTISGMIWFIDNNAPTCTSLSLGCGRLGSPFSDLQAFSLWNFGFDVLSLEPAPGDSIFLYRNTATDYFGGLEVRSNQKLGGQGMTVPLAGPGSFTGLTIPPFSATLPSTNGTRPVLSANNSSSFMLRVNPGVSLRGFNVSNTSSGGGNSGATLTGTSFNNLVASEISVTNIADGTSSCNSAIDLVQASGTANVNVTLSTVSSTRCNSGIILSSTSGSFTVNGGTIQNSNDDGIRATSVSGFSLSNVTVSNNGNSATDEGIELDNLSGTCSFTNVTATGNAHNNFDLDNTSGTLTSLTITGGSFSSNSAANGNNGFLFQARGTSTVSAVSISGTTFSNNVVIGPASIDRRHCYYLELHRRWLHFQRYRFRQQPGNRNGFLNLANLEPDPQDFEQYL